MLFPGLLIFVFLTIIRPQDFVLSMRGMPVVFIVMGTLLVAWFFSSYDKRFVRTAQDRYYLVFFFIIVVSTVSANWMAYTLDTAVETAKTVLIYWFIVSIVESMERFKTVLWAIMLLMTVVAGMAVLQSFDYDITGIGMYWANDKGVWQIRGVGLFDNPNDLAYSVVVVVPFALGATVRSSNFLTKAISFLMLSVAVFCIYLTRSRGGYLALLTCFVVWWYLWISSAKLRRVAFVLALVLVVAAFSASTSSYRDDESSMGRVESWAAGMHMLVTHPLTGVGKGMYIDYHKLDSHNSFVRAGAELGVFGLYAFVGILFSAFRSLYSVREDGNKDVDGHWKPYRIGFISYLSAYLVASLFSTRTYDIVFMILVALTSVFVRLSKTESDVFSELDVSRGGKGGDPESFWNRGILALTLVVLICWKMFLFQVW